MFQAKIKSEALKKVVDVISTLVDEAKFSITSENINVKAVDPAHVAMVDLKLSKEAFDEYEATEMEIGLDIAKFKEVLNIAKADDIISIKHDEDRNRLVINIENITRWMSLVDTAGMSDSKVPSLNLPVKVVIRTQELRQGILASKSVSDHITLTTNSNGFELSSEGDTDSVNLKLTKDLLEELKCEEDVKSMFSLDYFSQMIKSISSDIVTLNLGSDYPIRLEFEIANGNGSVNFLLAPRIESD